MLAVHKNVKIDSINIEIEVLNELTLQLRRVDLLLLFVIYLFVSR